MSDADKLPTIDIPAVEIFAEGSWNGDVYGAKDLDDMIAAFDRVGFKPPVKAGHEDGQEDKETAKRLFGEPALGYVNRIYRQGKKLMADLIGVPRVFANLIRAGSYKRISSEIYWSFKSDGGAVFPRVLKAVSFLGANIPALTGLKEIEALYKKNAAGFLYANDGAGNEFRLYDRDYQQSVPFGPVSDFLLTARRKTKASVSYSDNADQCGDCKFYIENINGCTLVEGFIEADDGCDLFEAGSENYKAKRKSKKYTIKKRDGKWCLLTHDGSKVLGCHDSEAGAIAQEKAVKANMERQETEVAMKVVKLDRDEIEKICPSCAELMATNGISALIFKTEEAAERFLYMTAAECMKDEKMVEKYPDAAGRKEKCGEMMKANSDSMEREIKRLTAEGGSMTQEEIKAAEKKLADGRALLEADRKKFDSDQEALQAKAKKDADEATALKEKENEQLRERVAEMERKHEDEQLTAWIAKQTQDRKLIPVEVSRLTAIFKAVRAMPKIVKYAEGGKDIEQTPEEALKALIESRKPHQLFTEFSRHEGEPETYENASTEADAKTKKYMAEKSEKSYSIALKAVLKADAGLNERYQRMQQ